MQRFMNEISSTRVLILKTQALTVSSDFGYSLGNSIARLIEYNEPICLVPPAGKYSIATHSYEEGVNL